MARKIQIAFVLSGVLVGVLVGIQLKTVVPGGGSYPLDVINSQKELIKTFIDEQGLLKGNIVSLRGEIEESQKKNQEISKNTNFDILDKLKEKIGLTAANGDGVSIFVDDSPFARREEIDTISPSLVHASDLRDIINLLRASHAKGIAINDQRVVPTTTITSAGGSILINNFHVAPPFNVSAICDSEVFVQQFLAKNQLMDLKKRRAENHLKLDLTVKKGIVLPVYNGELKTKFLQSKI